MVDSDVDMSDYIQSSGSDYEETPTTKKTKTAAKKSTTSRANGKATGKKAAAASSSSTASTSVTASDASTSASNSGQKTIEETYQKKTQLEHILLRPDTYIGAVESVQQLLWVYDSEKNRMVQRNIQIVPGFYKIVDEILVNAADNKIRDPSMDTIKVTIDKEKNMISVYNNGRGIPIEIHKEEKVYVPELIFGHLLTSSNYNDNERKVTGGRNGYGAKLCNIFSTEFIVETADRVKKYKQVFKDNMTKIGKPKVTDNPRKEEYTKITFYPDLAKFNMTQIDDDLEALLKKRVYDMAGTVSDVKVFLNGERIKIRNFKQYIDMYMNTDNAETKPTIVHQIVNDRWEVAFAVSDGQFQQVSFVNSVCTAKGGTHVTYIADQIANKVIETVKKKNKDAQIKLHQVKNHMWVFIKCLIENPSFDSQTKEYMTLRVSAFGSKCELSDDFIKKILKSGVVENILSWAKFKQDQQLKQTDGKKRTRITGIVKLEDANNAGTRNGHKCTLILTEGDSAKALAVSGLSVVGRDNYGVFPLRGKLLNVRDASHTQIMNNVEINQVKQILGLQHNKVYESTESLRYGHLMLMTDQDHDGSHIKGLIINFLDHFFPSLLKIPGFLREFITPIVKATKGNQTISFFTIPEYEAWKKETNNGKGWRIKYYKGLGTSTAEDAKRYFANMDRHLKTFRTIQDDERALIDMAFNKKKADDRKEWLRNYQPGTYVDHTASEIPISEFVNKELILFSMADNVRSIPSVVDGLKPGQRKVIYGCFKRKLTKEAKVAQLVGYVAEHSAYHHGEQSLAATIVGMAQNFVGSNNINLLEPRGQFGTRLQGGKDAASPRYIFTVLSPITRIIFDEADDDLLVQLNDDGQLIEPEWYVPIVPMVLINGSEGIGTGWSSFIPNYNPKDVVDNLRRLMRGEEPEPMHPWYRGFNGTIERVDDRYKVSGTIRKIDDTTVEITELPIRTWTQNYKEQLESWLNGTDKTPAFIKGYKEYHTDTRVHFVVTLSSEDMRKAEQEGLEKQFKLTTTISTNNMVCFDSQNRIKRYDSPLEILREFYDLRLTYYQRRKERLSDEYTKQWTQIDNRVRFIQEIISGQLVVQNRKKDAIIEDLRKRGYAAFPNADGRRKADTEVSDEESEEESGDRSADHGYNYLLSMPIWSLTYEKMQELIKARAQKEQMLQELLATSPKDLWNKDLDRFMEAWEKMQSELEQADSRATKVKKSRGKGKRPADAESDDEYVASPAKKKAATAATRKRPATPKATTAKTDTRLKQSTLTSTFKTSSADNTTVEASQTTSSADATQSKDNSASAPALSLAERLNRMIANKKSNGDASSTSTGKVTIGKAKKSTAKSASATSTSSVQVSTSEPVSTSTSKRAQPSRTARNAKKLTPYIEINGSSDDDDDNDDSMFVIDDTQDDDDDYNDE